MVHPGSLDSLGLALVVVGLILNGWVDSGCPLGWFGSSGVVGLRPWGRWDHSGLLGAFGFTLGDVAFIQGCV